MILDLAEQVAPLDGGTRLWHDLKDGKIRWQQLYGPWGCDDWKQCVFCSLHLAVDEYLGAFNGSQPMTSEDMVALFTEAFRLANARTPDIHTIGYFNGGSFLAMPEAVQVGIMAAITTQATIKRVVIESRPSLVTDEGISRLVEILRPHHIELTVRIGVETRRQEWRTKLLQKGMTDKAIVTAGEILARHHVTRGAYILLKPAPGIELREAITDAQVAINWVLGEMQWEEAYFCTTNVAPGSPLEQQWKNGAFTPAPLWAVMKVLTSTSTFNDRIHLLPFTDVPANTAIPAAQEGRFLPEDLTGATNEDLLLHQLLNNFRETRNIGVFANHGLQPPDWYSQS